MKLLFDQNLSHRLVALLSDCFPGSVHVRNVGLARADDASVWAYASDQGSFPVKAAVVIVCCFLASGFRTAPAGGPRRLPSGAGASGQVSSAHVTLPSYLEMVRAFARNPTPDSIARFVARGEQWRIQSLRELLAAIAHRDVEALAALPAAILIHIEAFLDNVGGAEATDGNVGAALQLLDAAGRSVPADFRRRSQLLILWAFQAALDVETLVPQLQAAIDRFGPDADLLVAQGTLFELLASRSGAEVQTLRVPPVDVVRELTKRSVNLSEAVRMGTPAEAQLQVERPGIYRLAARLYRRALALSRSPEAKLRLGKVSIEAGEHRAALQVLEELVTAREGSTRQRYLAQLFVGRACLVLGDADGALTAYRTAEEWYPGCQTPLVASSEALWMSGEVEGARAVMMQVLSDGARTSCPEDPWLSYHRGQSWRIRPTLRELEREVAR